MLEPFIKRKKNKKQQKANELVQKGLSQLEIKEYKQATISFTLALEEFAEEVAPTLQKEFDTLLITDKFAAIRAVGLVLLKTRQKDCELLNTLGNCARRLNEAKEANYFYRHALKVDKTYSIAFYSLAASLANVDLYDYQIMEALDFFERNNNFFLPEFRNNVYLTGKEDYKSTCKKLRRAIKENWRNCSILEGQLTLQNDIFNLGLLALANKDAETAYENFEKLKKQRSNIENLDMLIALTKTLHHPDLQESINMLVEQIREDPGNRLLNGNLGLLFRKAGNRLLSMKCFLVCYDLLKQFDGYFTHQALVRAADRKNKERDYKKALRLYKIATKDSEDPELWEKLANLYYQLQNTKEALKAFKQVVSLNPVSVSAKHKLHQIYNSLVEKAEELENKKKHQQAAVIFERALQIKRSPKLLENTARVYKSLRQFEKAENLLFESHKIRVKEKDLELENERQNLISKGKLYSKRQEFTSAIEYLENAARIKLDKDVFMYLAYIYKGLKRKRALENLMERWHQIAKPEYMNFTQAEVE